MKFYITIFNNIVIIVMAIMIYYLNSIEENNLNQKYEIGTYVF